MLGKTLNVSKLIKELQDKRKLLHMVCHANVGVDFMAYLLSNSEEKHNLLYPDNYTWTPLHYACRFDPSNHNLVKLLIKEYQHVVMQRDHFSR